MRRAATLTFAALLAAGVSACSGGSEASLPVPRPGFCEAADRYDRRVVRGAGIDEQITILEKLARNAPRDVAKDATTFLDAMRALRDGDESVVDDPDIKAAVEHVNRRAIDGCDLFESDPGSGL